MAEVPKSKLKSGLGHPTHHFDGSEELRRLLGYGPSRLIGPNSKTAVVDGRSLTDEEMVDFLRGKIVKGSSTGGSGSS